MSFKDNERSNDMSWNWTPLNTSRSIKTPNALKLFFLISCFFNTYWARDLLGFNELKTVSFLLALSIKDPPKKEYNTKTSKQKPNFGKPRTLGCDWARPLNLLVLNKWTDKKHNVSRFQSNLSDYLREHHVCLPRIKGLGLRLGILNGERTKTTNKTDSIALLRQARKITSEIT